MVMGWKAAGECGWRSGGNWWDLGSFTCDFGKRKKLARRVGDQIEIADGCNLAKRRLPHEDGSGPAER